MTWKTIETKWGLAYIIQTGRDGVMLVSLPEKVGDKPNNIKAHPNWRGGKCVNFLIGV